MSLASRNKKVQCLDENSIMLTEINVTLDTTEKNVS